MKDENNTIFLDNILKKDINIIYKELKNNKYDLESLIGKSDINYEDFAKSMEKAYSIKWNNKMAGFIKFDKYKHKIWNLEGKYVSYYIIKKYRRLGIMKKIISKTKKNFAPYFASVYLDNIPSLKIFANLKKQNNNLIIKPKENTSIAKINRKTVLFSIK